MGQASGAFDQIVRPLAVGYAIWWSLKRFWWLIPLLMFVGSLTRQAPGRYAGHADLARISLTGGFYLPSQAHLTITNRTRYVISDVTITCKDESMEDSAYVDEAVLPGEASGKDIYMQGMSPGATCRIASANAYRPES